MKDISESVKRFDFDEKIDGSAKYCADIKLENMLYAKTLRSERARARILSIEIPSLPEGYFIIDKDDVPGSNIVPIVFDDQPFFADGKVNYIGEPILLVVGPEKEKIIGIISNIKVNYEDLKPIFTIEEAENRKEDFIFNDKPCFVEYEFTKGNIQDAIKNSKYFIEDEFKTGYQEHAYLETQSMIGIYEDNRIKVYGSMQCPYPEYSWGSNVVEVQIDPITYEVNVLGIWTVYDIGTPIDSKIVKVRLMVE